MKALPLGIGTIHFVGIGGIGMSGIAEVLHTLGYSVQGSDVKESANVKRLRDIGITIHIGHREENLGAAGVIVTSTAVKADNAEVQAARQRLIPVVRRAEMLGELMRLKWSIAVGGTHGKTTTTSLIAQVLDVAGMDPTVINGGIINAWGSNARLGGGDWMVAEADESDGTFLKLPATIAVVTNIDPEHLDHYGNFDKLRQAFDAFVENIPFYGFAALCIDHAEVQAMIPRVSDRRIVTYGFSPQADVRALGLTMTFEQAQFDVHITERKSGTSNVIEGLELPMLGQHNVQNALAAIAIASEMGISEDVIRRALKSFQGVNRRFTRVGVAGGVQVIDDYGHHPVEITAVLKAARAGTKGKVIAVVQPHRYTRLRDLFEEFCTCFNDADAVIVADVFEAGEAPIEGFNRDTLVEGLGHHGHRTVLALGGPKDLARVVHGLATSGDMVVCLGAGDITGWAQALPDELTRLQTKGRGAANDDG
ncbi:MAG: UDP-N-acetylmuramate--L-alanine ligase [Proteobacteria bacterium]|nr:UDP-N-acetylmuramate--L-alanine ligase [Pseudomonadota bacterium]MDA1023046.1 UDP-N-acetylmuramate--L-alanine ligase [Pseudomonadota bacterium]